MAAWTKKRNVYPSSYMDSYNEFRHAKYNADIIDLLSVLRKNFSSPTQCCLCRQELTSRSIRVQDYHKSTVDVLKRAKHNILNANAFNGDDYTAVMQMSIEALQGLHNALHVMSTSPYALRNQLGGRGPAFALEAASIMPEFTEQLDHLINGKSVRGLASHKFAPILQGTKGRLILAPLWTLLNKVLDHQSGKYYDLFLKELKGFDIIKSEEVKRALAANVDCFLAPIDSIHTMRLKGSQKQNVDGKVCSKCWTIFRGKAKTFEDHPCTGVPNKINMYPLEHACVVEKLKHTVESFSHQQKEVAVAGMGGSDYLMIAGAAGFGKSYVTKHCILYWCAIVGADKVLVAAPLKNAAMAIGGQTLHALFRLPVDNLKLKKLVCVSDYAALISAVNLHIETAFSKHTDLLLFQIARVLFLDEFPQLFVEQLEFLDYFCRVARNEMDKHFGGLFVRIVGDWSQPGFGCRLTLQEQNQIDCHFIAKGSLIFAPCLYDFSYCLLDGV